MLSPTWMVPDKETCLASFHLVAAQSLQQASSNVPPNPCSLAALAGNWTNNNDVNFHSLNMTLNALIFKLGHIYSPLKHARADQGAEFESFHDNENTKALKRFSSRCFVENTTQIFIRHFIHLQKGLLGGTNSESSLYAQNPDGEDFGNVNLLSGVNTMHVLEPLSPVTVVIISIFSHHQSLGRQKLALILVGFGWTFLSISELFCLSIPALQLI